MKCCFHKASAQILFFLHFIYFGELQKQCQNQLSCLSRIIIICKIIFFCLNGAFCQSLLIRFVKRQRTWFTVVDQNDKNWGTCLFPFMMLPHLWADLFAKKFPSLSVIPPLIVLLSEDDEISFGVVKGDTCSLCYCRSFKNFKNCFNSLTTALPSWNHQFPKDRARNSLIAFSNDSLVFCERKNDSLVKRS